MLSFCIFHTFSQQHNYRKVQYFNRLNHVYYQVIYIYITSFWILKLDSKLHVCIQCIHTVKNQRSARKTSQIVLFCTVVVHTTLTRNRGHLIFAKILVFIRSDLLIPARFKNLFRFWLQGCFNASLCKFIQVRPLQIDFLFPVGRPHPFYDRT